VKKLLLALVLGAAGATLGSASLFACSSSTTDAGTPAPGTEAGSDVAQIPDSPANKPLDARTDVAAPEASTDGSTTCNALTQMATEATMATIKGAAPAGSGGAILPGKYFLKEIDVYDPTAAMASPPSPSGLITTLVIAGNVMDSIQDLPDGSSQAFSETFAVNGAVLTRNLTCPKVAPDLAATYTVTATGITIYETDPMSMLVAGSVYAKQP
jgi:hypothetical protein